MLLAAAAWATSPLASWSAARAWMIRPVALMSMIGSVVLVGSHDVEVVGGVPWRAASCDIYRTLQAVCWVPCSGGLARLGGGHGCDTAAWACGCCPEGHHRAIRRWLGRVPCVAVRSLVLRGPWWAGLGGPGAGRARGAGGSGAARRAGAVAGAGRAAGAPRESRDGPEKQKSPGSVDPGLFDPARCAKEDSNLHGVIPHKALNLARLPIPPLAQDGGV